MMKKLIFKLIINAVALLIAAKIVDGIQLSDNILNVAIVAIVFGIINTIIKPLVKLLTLPIIFLSLGIFTVVINALMLLLTDFFTDSLIVNGFWAAIWGSIVISLVNILLNALLAEDRKG